MNGVKFLSLIAIFAILACGCDPGMRQHGGSMPPPDPLPTTMPSNDTPTTIPDKTKQLPELDSGSGKTTANESVAEQTPEMARNARMQKILGEWVGEYVLPNNTNARIQQILNAQVKASATTGKPTLKISDDGQYSFFNLGLTTSGDFNLLETVLECKPDRFNGMPFEEFKTKGYKDFQGKNVKPDADATPPSSFAIEILEDTKQLRYSPTGNTWILFSKKGS